MYILNHCDWGSFTVIYKDDCTVFICDILGKENAFYTGGGGLYLFETENQSSEPNL
jgi:hypothetical protein